MQRVSVVGNSGSGKTTFATALAGILAAPYLELDSVFHQPGWTPLPDEDFRERVGDFVAGDRWVVDGNYSTVRDLVWARADTVVWLDPERRIVMRRLVSRTIRRAAVRRQLWNGNRERWANLFSADPERSVIAWGWTQHHAYRSRYEQAMADPQGLTFVRLRTPAETAAFLGRLRDEQ